MSRCIVDGCTCKDNRVLNTRRMRFVRATHTYALPVREGLEPLGDEWPIITRIDVSNTLAARSLASRIAVRVVTPADAAVYGQPRTEWNRYGLM